MRLALTHEGSGSERFETIQAYTVPPWQIGVWTVCEADRYAAIAAAKIANDSVIATSASDREWLVGIGGIVAHRSPDRIDEIVARYLVTLGSRDD